MKLCTSTNILNFDLGKAYSVSMETSVRGCAAAGYHYIDASLCGFSRPGQPLTGDDWERWAHESRALGDELGIEYSQAHAYWTIGNPFLDDMARVDGEWGEELMRRSVLAAEILGVKWMVVHPYTVYEDTEAGYDYDRSFAYNREYFKKWGEFYADHHVGMAIENMGRKHYCSDPGQLLELIGAVDNPLVQVCIDTGHAHLSGYDVPALLRQIGSSLKATHIADNHRNLDEHFAPFNGTIDWPEVMKALREIGYEESFAFEIHHLSSMYPASVQQYLVNFSYELGKYLMGL